MRKMAMIGAMLAASMASAASRSTFTLLDSDPLDIDVRRRRGGRGGSYTKRGKRAPRRHGAKMKPNRRIVSKRVRRKHRRAK